MAKLRPKVVLLKKVEVRNQQAFQTQTNLIKEKYLRILRRVAAVYINIMEIMGIYNKHDLIEEQLQEKL